MERGGPVRPGVPAVCAGHVAHRRLLPEVHEFRYPVSYVWLDPDAPGDLCRHHPLWSATHPSPARFRSLDYGDGSTVSLGDQVRDELCHALGRRPAGQVRMLTQLRRWGWLFNPITLYVAWDSDDVTPAGAVLEVTNTPWKERHRYAVALDAARSSQWCDSAIHRSGTKSAARVTVSRRGIRLCHRYLRHRSPGCRRQRLAGPDDRRRQTRDRSGGSDDPAPARAACQRADAHLGSPCGRTSRQPIEYRCASTPRRQFSG